MPWSSLLWTCGVPLGRLSVSGKTYMMVIVDSGTSFKAGEFLADKSDEMTMAAFDRFRKMVETQTGRKVKRCAS